MNLYSVPDVIFKSDFGAGKESTKAMPWFRIGSVHCLVETGTPGKPALLKKIFSVSKHTPHRAQLQRPYYKWDSKAAGLWLSTHPCKHGRSTQVCSCPASGGITSPCLSTIACRSSRQEAMLQVDSHTWGMVYQLSGDYCTANNLLPFPHRFFCAATHSAAYNICTHKKVVYVKLYVVTARLLPLQLISFKPGLGISTLHCGLQHRQTLIVNQGWL